MSENTNQAAENVAATETAAAESPPQDVAAKEIADLKDKLLRALAESENIRRRGQKEREDAFKFAIAGFAREMLPVADNLRRALESLASQARVADEGLALFADGVELTERELLAALERNGIKKIIPLPGERYDAQLHEAMFEVPTADAPAGTIVQVMEPGYVIHDRLLRPARVGVAKAGPAAEGEHKLDTTA